MTAIIGDTASRFRLAQLFQNPLSASAASSTASATGGTSDSAGPALRVTLSAQTKLASLLVLPDDLAKSLAEDQKKAAALAATVEQVKKSMVYDRKAAALERLDRARRELELLRMFGGDPKAVAREAKRIAQEIRSAAREYSAALKAEGGSDASAAGAGAADASASTTALAEEGATQVGTAMAGGAAAKPADGSAAGATAPAAAPQEQQKETDPDAARQSTVQAYQDAAARIAAKADKERGEQEILAKFKDAAREAKRLIEEAARKLKAKNPSDPDARDAERAKAAMDKAIEELSDTMHAQQNNAAGEAVIGALAGVTTADAAAPVLDILT